MSKVAKIVTDQFIKMIEDGMVDGTWKPCWNKGMSFPRNVKTKNPYRGINVLLLWGAMVDEGYEHSIWGTFNQWKAMGYKLKDAKGKGKMVVFWKILEREETATDGSTKIKKVPLLRYSTVFNCAHVEGFEPEAKNDTLDSTERMDHIDSVIHNTRANIAYGGDRACFIPSMDMIQMPRFESFHNTHGFYSTVFHELAHWTGHHSRLNRDLSGRFGDHAYGMEELVAELSAAFTCAELGFESTTRDDHVKYIKGWLEKIKEDHTAIITAASKAAKATEYILSQEVRNNVDADNLEKELKAA